MVDQADDFDVVTGAYGYTGRYVARRLLAAGRTVRTLTGRPPSQSPFGAEVRAFPFNFDDPVKLTQTLRGAKTVYNTYWVRFSHGEATFEQAVTNTRTLVRCAADAGVQRLVHVSIANASADSALPYFRSKGILENDIAQSRLSHAIIRPTVIFGPEDILINNIAWLLRKLPIFGIPGSGEYRLQPVFVEDMADIMIRAGTRQENETIDAVGPDIMTFEGMVRLIRDRIKSRTLIVHMHPGLALLIARLVGRVIGDVMLTRDELDGLEADLLISSDPPTGKTRFCDWLNENHGALGTTYHSELQRHFQRSDNS